MSSPTLESFPLVSQHGPLHHSALGHTFDSPDDFITLPSTWGGPHWKELTVEAWINPSANTGDFQAIVSPANTTFVHFQIHSIGNISVYTDQGLILLPVIPVEPLNQWRHVAVIAKSGASKVLIDGNQYGSTNTKTFNYITPTNELYIGKGHAGGRHFKGRISDVHIWQEAREHEHIHGDLYKYLTDKPELVVPPAVSIFGFKSHFGKYMSAQPNGTMECNRDQLFGWEKFTVEDAGEGKVGLKSFHGKYLSAQPDGRLQVNRDWLFGWEKFTLEEQDGKVGLKGAHGKYISAQPDGSIACDRSWLQAWELFSKEATE